MDEALSTLNEGILKYPEDNTLLVSSINIYLQLDRVDDALASLSAAIDQEPTNASYYYARGTLYDKNADIEKAIADYEKAIELKPDYFEAYYNIGAIYVNQSGEIQEKMNELPFSAQKEYDALKAERDEKYKMAIPPLEKALEIQPDDAVAGQTLMQLYGKVGNNDGYNELKARFMTE
jgi:tetratricopeptide (TPR) repeat protein